MDPTVVAAWIAAGVSLLTLAGTLAAQYLGYRASSKDAGKTAEEQREQLDRTLTEQNQQLDRTLNQQREQLDRTLTEQNQQLDRTLAEQRTRTLNERFATAAEQLGSDKPAVRVAGVYAMAGLANDWPESRQTCVDVLCAYLRMPYEPEPGSDAATAQRLAFEASREVSHTVIRIIVAHLQKDAAISWQGLDFDFTGVVFDEGNFSGAVFSGGTVSFAGAQFPRIAINFMDVKFSGGEINFSAAQFSGAMVDFARAQFSGARVNFGASFSGGVVYFRDAEFSSGAVDFSFARFSDGEVSFMGSTFCGSIVEFFLAQFSGGEVDFRTAEFCGGEVDFNDAADWSVPPTFPWSDADTPPPSVKLPKKEDQPEALWGDGAAQAD
jgi:hypothetical protein